MVCCHRQKRIYSSNCRENERLSEPPSASTSSDNSPKLRVRSTAAAMDKKSISDPKRSAAVPSELAKSGGNNGKKVVIKSADMPEDLQKDAVDIAIAAFEEKGVEKDVAEWIKKEFDKKHGPTWHCIVGRNFGSYVTHETNHFVYFYLDQKAVLLFKSG